MRSPLPFVLAAVLVFCLVPAIGLMAQDADPPEVQTPTKAFQLRVVPQPELPPCFVWKSVSCDSTIVSSAPGKEGHPLCEYVFGQVEGSTAICLGEDCKALLKGKGKVIYRTIKLFGEEGDFCGDDQ